MYAKYPALIGKGMSGLIANANTSESQKALASDLMAAVGITVWVETEQAIDAVTAVSGSGPAYYFLFIEAMQEAAENGSAGRHRQNIVYANCEWCMNWPTAAVTPSANSGGK